MTGPLNILRFTLALCRVWRAVSVARDISFFTSREQTPLRCTETQIRSSTVGQLAIATETRRHWSHRHSAHRQSSFTHSICVCASFQALITAAFFSSHNSGRLGPGAGAERRNMGSSVTTLTAWEAKDTLARVTEARLRCIRTLRVSSAEIGSLLALKANSLVALQTVIFSTDLTPYQQEQIALTLGGARATCVVAFDGLNPLAGLVESALGLPLLHSIRFTNLLLTDSVPAALARRLPHLLSLRFLLFDNVIMSPQSLKLITGAACPATCRLSLINMSHAMT